MRKHCSCCGKKFGFFDFENECKFGCGGLFCSDCVIHDTEFKIELDNNYYLNISLPDNLTRPKVPNNLENVRYSCNICLEKFKKDVKYYNNKINELVEQSKNIEIFPSTYKGKINCNKDSVIPIETEFMGNRDSAEIVLRVTALLNCCDIVFDNKFEKTTCEMSGSGKGTYYYTAWKCLAKCAKK